MQTAYAVAAIPAPEDDNEPTRSLDFRFSTDSSERETISRILPALYESISTCVNSLPSFYKYGDIV